MKNTIFGEQSEACDLSYLGDCKVEEEVNIGAGSTITKNVAPESLALARSKRIEKQGRARRKKRK